MRYTKELTRFAFGMLAGILPVSAIQGCALVGPSSLSRGRVAYAEVIAETNAEQSLATLVRMRYGAPWVLVAVSSVTAQVRFSANARAEFGVGPEANFAGALVPLSGGVAYDENPTYFLPAGAGRQTSAAGLRVPRHPSAPFWCPLSTSRSISRTRSHCW